MHEICGWRMQLMAWRGAQVGGVDLPYFYLIYYLPYLRYCLP